MALRDKLRDVLARLRKGEAQKGQSPQTGQKRTDSSIPQAGTRETPTSPLSTEQPKADTSLVLVPAAPVPVGSSTTDPTDPTPIASNGSVPASSSGPVPSTEPPIEESPSMDRTLQPRDSAQEPLNGNLPNWQRKDFEAELAPGMLRIALENRTNSANVYAYITGRAINNDNALWLLQSDGRSPYFPVSPSDTGSAVLSDISIPLGAPGNTVTVIIPQLAGARIWFSIDQPLRFLLNPGPALVEPSVLNPADPNIATKWGFAEFTFNSAQLYANISSVDFVSMPISMSLTNKAGEIKTVHGLFYDGVDRIAAGLRAQSELDNQPWNDLVISRDSRVLRILSPNSLITTNRNAFNGYFEPYTNWVWGRYFNNWTMQVEIAGRTYTGRVEDGQLNVGGIRFSFPSTGDIFSSNSGPFTTGGDTLRNQIIPILAASFNRSTLLVTPRAPAPLDAFYKQQITNHFSRILHENSVGGAGYAFPYDDVSPADGGPDQSGYVNDGSPALLRVTVGGTA